MRKSLRYNFSLAVFTGFCLEYKKISGRGLVMLTVYWIKLLIAIPFDLLQKLIYGKKIAASEIEKTPLFIIGHYRSGTTYLHNLLSKDERFAYLSNYDMICPSSCLLFGSGLKWFLQGVIHLFNIKTSMFNNKTPELDEPAEEDRFFINKASSYTDYWGFLFPKQKHGLKQCTIKLADENYFDAWKNEYLALLQLITYKHSGKKLLLKSPANTMRIKYLLRLFPNAKFIYLCRNPYDVFYSMRNLWMRSIKKYCLQHATKAEIEEIVLSHFEEMMEQYERDKGLIRSENLYELQYEQFEKDPFGAIRDIYQTFGLPEFDAFSGRLRVQLSKEKSYKRFQHVRDADTMKVIGQRWGKYIEQWKKRNESNLQLKNELNAQPPVANECNAQAASVKRHRHLSKYSPY